MFRRYFAKTDWLVGAFFLLLLNSAYLAAYANPTLAYFVQVAVHPLLGLGLAVWVIGWVRATRPQASALLWLGLGVSGVGLALGLAVFQLGATRPYRWLLLWHIWWSAAGAALLLVHIVLSAWRSARRGVSPSLAVGLAAVVFAAAFSVAATGRYDHQRRETYRIANPKVVPASMEEEGAGASSPFHPSSANTDTGGLIPANFFLTSEACGRCHKDIYDQWNSSAHHFSSFNNQWYRKSIEYMQDVVGTKPSKWCAGCHDHAVFFNGRFDRPMKEQIDTPEARRATPSPRSTARWDRAIS
jgi:hypothetical protein